MRPASGTWGSLPTVVPLVFSSSPAKGRQRLPASITQSWPRGFCSVPDIFEGQAAEAVYGKKDLSQGRG